MLELLQPELIADGESDKAKRHLGDNIQMGHRLGAGEAQGGEMQRPQAVGAQQQPGHQVGGDGGKVEQLGHPGHQQPAHQGKGQLNQDFH